MNKDLIDEVFVPTLGSQGQVGTIATGYPVGRDRILTARHSLFPEQDPARDPAFPIEVRWHYPGAAPDWQPVKGIPWESERWDLVLLDCELPRAVLANRGFLSEARPDESMRWKGVGFPRVSGKRDNRRKPFNMQGKVYSMLSGESRFAVSEEAGPTEADDWKGASGAPVFVDWRILGVIVSVPPNLQAKRLEVTPMWRVLREEAAFRKEIGFDEHRQRHDAISQVLKDYLANSDTATDALAKRRPELHACLGGAANRMEKAALLAEGLLDLQVPELIHVCQQAHSALARDPAAHVLREIIQILLPAIYDHGVVETVRNACGAVTAELLTLPACFPTVAEIIMAGADRRPAAFCERAREDEFPRGRLNLPAPPECGFDTDGEQARKALDAHLAGKFCWTDPEPLNRLSATVDNFMIQRFPGQSIPGVERPRDRRIQVAAREIAYQAKTLGRTYYLIVPAPADSNEKAALANTLAAIRERYSGLMCISLQSDPDAEDTEFTCFRPLLELLPKKGTPTP